MYKLIQSFINILLFRAGPQDVPASYSALKLVVIACFASDILGAISTLGPGLAALLSAGQLTLYSALVYLLLKFNNKTERWLQTLVALFGSLALINIASFPFIQNLNLFSEGQLVVTPGIMIVAALQIWFFIVMARILRDALEVTMGRALLLTFLIINIVPLVLSSVIGMLGLNAPTLIIDPTGSDG